MTHSTIGDLIVTLVDYFSLFLSEKSALQRAADVFAEIIEYGFSVCDIELVQFLLDRL